MDHIVLDDPALGPVGADESGLVGGGRGPRAGRLRELEAAYGDVVDVVLGGGEHRLAHVDLRGSALGSAPPKLAQTVVVSAPTSAYQTSRVCAGLRTRSVVRVQWSVTSVRSGGSVTSSRLPTS